MTTITYVYVFAVSDLVKFILWMKTDVFKKSNNDSNSKQKPQQIS